MSTSCKTNVDVQGVRILIIWDIDSVTEVVVLIGKHANAHDIISSLNSQSYTRSPSVT